MAQRFTACERIEDLAELDFDTDELQLFALKPRYHVFEVPKSNGKTRLIEAPEPGLKAIQRQLSDWLQCVYFREQTQAAFGYIMRVRDVLPVKNILEHAQQHLGCTHLLNVDFQDFFHQVSYQDLLQLFQQAPFRWTKRAAATLAALCTRNGRLPMGAPTSPVLSNLATRALDQALQSWAATKAITYTRFVDDLSFSAKYEITAANLQEIQSICERYEFRINPQKIKWYPPGKEKKVTGLVLNETVDIEPSFYHELNRNLNRLQHLSEVNMIINQHRENELYQEFKQEVQGMINFIGMIEGYGSQQFYDYRQKLKQALEISEQSLSARWTNSNYF